MNNILVYRHRTLDTKEVFYVGIGLPNRPYRKNGRTLYWKNVVNKHGYSIEIIKENISWVEACELEQLLILEYGRRDLKTGTLVNLTSGGDGVKDYKFDKETIQKIREQNLGRKHTPQQNKEKSIRQQGQGGMKVIDTSTQIVYPSIVIASRSLHIPKSTLRRYLVNNSNKTTLKFLKHG